MVFLHELIVVVITLLRELKNTATKHFKHSSTMLIADKTLFKKISNKQHSLPRPLPPLGTNITFLR